MIAINKLTKIIQIIYIEQFYRYILILYWNTLSVDEFVISLGSLFHASWSAPAY